LRVADAVEFEESPPSQLKAVWHTRRFGNPYGGGWLEWPAGEADKIAILDNVESAFSGYKNAGVNIVEWTKANPDKWKLIGRVKKNRRINQYAHDLGGEFHKFTRKIIELILDGDTQYLTIFGVSGFDIPPKITDSYFKRMIDGRNT